MLSHLTALSKNIARTESTFSVVSLSVCEWSLCVQAQQSAQRLAVTSHSFTLCPLSPLTQEVLCLKGFCQPPPPHVHTHTETPLIATWPQQCQHTHMVYQHTRTTEALTRSAFSFHPNAIKWLNSLLCVLTTQAIKKKKGMHEWLPGQFSEPTDIWDPDSSKMQMLIKNEASFIHRRL